MEAIEFRTKIKNGTIQIPKKYTQKIGNTVKVIILCDHISTPVDLVDELLKNPIRITDSKPISRDKIYDRI